MFKTPQPGDVITVVMRSGRVYENAIVQQPFDWLSKFEFCIPADGIESRFANIESVERFDGAPKFNQLAGRYETSYTPSNCGERFTTRVLHMKNVVSINGHDVANEDFTTKTVMIQGSSTIYNVTVEGGIGVSCECKGFQFRKSCRHLKEAEAA